MSKKQNKEKRTCRLCHEEKPLNLFEIDSRLKGKYTTRCKSCKSGLNDRAGAIYRRLKYRSEKYGIKFEIKRHELDLMFSFFDGECVYCNKNEKDTGRSHHVDHVIAESKGGRQHISNLVLSCEYCNISKHDNSFLEFYFRNKNKISDESFMSVVYYVAIMSGQSAKDIRDSFLNDYVYEVMNEDLSETERRAI